MGWRLQVDVAVERHKAVYTLTSCRVWGRPGNSATCSAQPDSNTGICSSRQAHPAGPWVTGLAVGQQLPQRWTLESQLLGGLPSPAGRPSSPDRLPPPLAACWQLQAEHKESDGPVCSPASQTHLSLAGGCLLTAACGCREHSRSYLAGIGLRALPQRIHNGIEA